MYKFKKTIALSATVLAFAGFGVSAQAANGFANGGFETVGVTTPADSWLQAASGYTRSTDAHSGSFSAQLASPALNAAIMLQNSIEQGGLPALTAGDTPTFSFWAKGFAGGTGNVLFALRYLDGIGNILATSNNQFFQGSINTNTWSQISYNLGAVPVGATAAFVEFSQGIGPIDAGNPAGKVLIDDINLAVAGPVTPVPEPETYAMMLAGLAGLAFMRRRRPV